MSASSPRSLPRSVTRLTLARLVFGLGLVCATASAGDLVHLRSPLPFDHQEHAGSFARNGVGCLDCHPVGMRASTPGGSEPPLPEPPTSSCHGCHLGELAKAPRSSPDTCTLCHTDLSGLVPNSHNLEWISLHGDASRAASSDCTSCHRASECLDCHDRRGAGSEEPHPVGFRSTHGVDARLDPRSCSSCHTEASCTSCHLQQGALPW